MDEIARSSDQLPKKTQELLGNVQETKRRPRLFSDMLRIIIHIFFKNHVDAGLKIGDDEVMTPFENFNYLG